MVLPFSSRLSFSLEPKPNSSKAEREKENTTPTELEQETSFFTALPKLYFPIHGVAGDGLPPLFSSSSTYFYTNNTAPCGAQDFCEVMIVGFEGFKRYIQDTKQRS